MTIEQQLHFAIAAVCPIVGVCIGKIDDKSTWRIDFEESATAQQRAAAQAVLAAFSAEDSAPTVEELEAKYGLPRWMRDLIIAALPTAHPKRKQAEELEKKINDLGVRK